MKIVEHPFDGQNDLIRQYSDIGEKLWKVETDEMYDEAVDLYPCQYTYKETDIPIEEEPIEENNNITN